MHPKLAKFQKSTKALFKHALSGSGEVLNEDLIRCEKCYLTVHKVCYNINVYTNNHWLCDRCMKNSEFAVSILQINKLSIVARIDYFHSYY